MPHHLRKILFALAWMTVPFLSAFGVMKLLAVAPDRTQRIAFCLLLLICAVGQFLALVQLTTARPPNADWKLAIYALKIVAFVCLFSFAAYTLIAAYFTLFRAPSPSSMYSIVNCISIENPRNLANSPEFEFR